MSYQIHLADSDLAFTCAPDQSVLDAALKAGIELPYSCRKGVCGNCAVPLRSGRVQRSPAASAEATPDGHELMCQCRPLEDLTIAPAHWRRADPLAHKRLQVRVFRNTLAAPDVSVLHLRLPSGQRAKFRAGQYLQITLADGSRRSYSMANPPHESDSLQLHVRHVAGGAFSGIAPTLKPGDLVDVELPFGQVALDLESTEPLLCLCGGTGFAPVKSLLDDLARRRSKRAITLIWGGRQRSSLYLLDHLPRWARAFESWRFIAALGDAQQAAELGGFHGRVDAALRDRLPGDLSGEVYCCGSPALVSTLRAMCVDERGLPAECFHADVFVPGPAG